MTIAVEPMVLVGTRETRPAGPVDGDREGQIAHSAPGTYERDH